MSYVDCFSLSWFFNHIELTRGYLSGRSRRTYDRWKGRWYSTSYTRGRSCRVDSHNSQPKLIALSSQVLRNIGTVKHADTTGFPNIGGLAKQMISQGVRYVVIYPTCILTSQQTKFLDLDHSVYEVAFWDPTPTEKLARTSRAPSCPGFIDVVVRSLEIFGFRASAIRSCSPNFFSILQINRTTTHYYCIKG